MTETSGRELRDFADFAARVPLQEGLIEGCDAFVRRFPPDEALGVAARLNFANPFYLPAMGAENAQNLAIGSAEFAAVVLRARITAHHADQPNILLACAPKSASTFIQSTLCHVSGLPNVTLNATTERPGTASVLGIDLREQELDELALIRHGLNGSGYVAQHHVRATPYLCAQLDRFRIRPIVSYRNVFDSLVSLDDMLMAARREAGNANLYFNDAMPSDYTAMEREERLLLLAGRMAAWYLQFYLSWRRVERAGLVTPLWISYEADFLGDKDGLARRLSAFLGPQRFPAATLSEALADRDRGRDFRLNQGVAGRGADMPTSVRDLVRRLYDHYGREEDLTPLLGG